MGLECDAYKEIEAIVNDSFLSHYGMKFIKTA